MNPIPVAVVPELHEFSLKVLSIPKWDVIEVFTTNGTDDSFNEGVRYRRIRDGQESGRHNESSSSLAIGGTGITDRCQS